MKRFRLLLALASVPLGLTAASVLPASAVGAVAVIGQTPASAPDAQCGPGWRLQTNVYEGASYTVPTGNWAITSWSTYSGTGAGSMSLVVFRPVADGYQVVGVSATETLTANSLNTFTLAGPIPVQAGDILGSWAADSTNCLFATDSAWDMASFSLASLPSVGDVVASSGGLEYYRVNISATLTSAAPSAQDQIAALKAKIIGWNLKRDTSAELREPLTEALAALRQHERADAIGAMRDFIQTVRDQPRRALSQSQAAELISDAQAIIATLRSS